MDEEKVSTHSGSCFAPLTRRLRDLTLPGLQSTPVYEIALFFVRGFGKGSLVTRASAIAFNILLAILPATIFFFTLIPFVSIPGFQTELLNLLGDILPKNVFGLLENTLIDVVTRKSGGLLVFMFLMTLILSSNGLHALISAFNLSRHQLDTRSWFGQRMVALSLFPAFAALIGLAAVAILFGKMFLLRVFSRLALENRTALMLVNVGRWFGIVLLILVSLSMLYYFAPGKRTRWRFFSPGSLVATLLFVLSSLVFSTYVNHFGLYNKLYGSIGTLLVILLWIYFNSVSILLGFELNASIMAAEYQHGRLRLYDGKKE